MCAFNYSLSEISDKWSTPATDHHLLLSLNDCSSNQDLTPGIYVF